ncbi:MAG: ABC transporter permease [Candidatus Puniceispirillum sp.]|nr:ABC transporter permease [Candidatus Puniceispirillum sp.]
MFQFLARRVFQSSFVLLVTGLIAFSMFRFVGDPVENMMGQERTDADIELLREKLGLNDPFFIQYKDFLIDAAHGDLGISFRQGRPVVDVLIERLPATLELAAVSAFLAIFLGVSLGVYTAINPKGWFTNIILTVSLIGVSLPTFLIGILLIYLFAVELGWLPSFGRGEVVEYGWWTTGLTSVSGIKAIILPALTLGLYQMTMIMRLVRSEMTEVLNSDFIRFARSRGLPEGKINFRHALKNTLVPVITVTGLQLGSIIAFAIITETVFQWPGLGLLFIDSVQFVDIPVMASYLMFISVMFVSINLIVDLLYAVIDPRLSISGTK